MGDASPAFVVGSTGDASGVGERNKGAAPSHPAD